MALDQRRRGTRLPPKLGYARRNVDRQVRIGLQYPPDPREILRGAGVTNIVLWHGYGSSGGEPDAEWQSLLDLVDESTRRTPTSRSTVRRLDPEKLSRLLVRDRSPSTGADACTARQDVQSARAPASSDRLEDRIGWWVRTSKLRMRQDLVATAEACERAGIPMRESSAGSTPTARIGDRLEVIPLHICSCVNMFDLAYGVRGGQVDHEIAIAARGKVR